MSTGTLDRLITRFLPRRFWRRVVWVSKGSGKIQSRVTVFYPFWHKKRVRRRIESLPQFSHWHVYPDGTFASSRLVRSRLTRLDPIVDDEVLKWAQEVAKRRGLL